MVEMRKLDILYRKNKRNNVSGGIFIDTVILQISMRYDNDNVMNEKKQIVDVSRRTIATFTEISW